MVLSRHYIVMEKATEALSESVVWDWKPGTPYIPELAFLGCGVDLEHGFPALAGHQNHLTELAKIQRPECYSRPVGSKCPGT